MTINYESPDQTATGAGNVIRLDSAQSDFKANATIKLSGTATAKLQYTLTKPDMSNASDNWAGAEWIDDTTLTGITATTTGLIDTPVEAVRLNVTAYTDGNCSLHVVQGDG